MTMEEGGTNTLLGAESPPPSILQRGMIELAGCEETVREVCGEWAQEETFESLYVWLQLVLVTGTQGLLETTNVAMAIMCAFASVSLVGFSLYDSFGWAGAAPFLLAVALLLVAIYKTTSRIDKMDSFAVEFKNADRGLGLQEREQDERKRNAEVRTT